MTVAAWQHSPVGIDQSLPFPQAPRPSKRQPAAPLFDDPELHDLAIRIVSVRNSGLLADDEPLLALRYRRLRMLLGQRMPDRYEVAGLVVNRLTRQVFVHGVELRFSPCLFSVLLALLDAQGGVTTHQAVSRAGWGIDVVAGKGRWFDRHYLQQAVYRIRTALQIAGWDTARIVTVHGRGWVLETR